MNLQGRVLSLLLALLLAVLTVTLVSLSRVTYRHTVDRAAEELAYARRVLLDKLDSREGALVETASTLAKDDALRQAIFSGTGDVESVRVALDNFRRRTTADLAALVELDGTVLVDTAEPARQARPFAHPDLLRVRAPGEARPHAVVIDGVAYQLAVVPYYVPVSAPQPVLWLLLGRAVDDLLADELSDLFGVEVAVLAGDDAGTGPDTGDAAAPAQVVASSLPASRSAELTSLPAAAPAVTAIRNLGGEDYFVAAAPLRGVGRASLDAVLLLPTARALLGFRQLVGRVAAIAAIAALVALLGAYAVARGVTRPLRGLTTAAQRIAAGDYAAALPTGRREGEVGQLAREFAAMHQAVREREAAIEHLAYHDELTALPNRNRLRAELARQIEQAALQHQRLAVAMLDLDRFKEINDTLGHHVGDRVLLELARRLRELAAERSLTVARLGGDEFALLMTARGVAETRSAIESLRIDLGRVIAIDELRIDARASFGIALYPDHGGDPATLLRQAEVAMYVAKERRLGSAFYDSSQDRHSVERLSLVAELRQAVEDDQLSVSFQPKLDLRTGSAHEVEALVRWEHPRRGAISPSELIAVAEQTGLIRDITAWMLRRALAQVAAWQRDGLTVTVAVNLSALDLYDPELPARVRELLAASRVPAAQLVLEITESSAMADPETARRLLDEVTAMGVRVSVDDFGTGYSSLAQLQRLPVAELKIDRSFVLELLHSPDVRQIVRSTIELGHNLGLEVVAEGVETAEALEALRAMGCDKIQGFHVSRPRGAADLALWLQGRQPGAPLAELA